jgi:hypothetical protein
VPVSSQATLHSVRAQARCITAIGHVGAGQAMYVSNKVQFCRKSVIFPHIGHIAQRSPPTSGVTNAQRQEIASTANIQCASTAALTTASPDATGIFGEPAASDMTPRLLPHV